MSSLCYKDRKLKRIFDLLFSILSLVFLAPFFLVIAVLLKFEGLVNPSFKGPVFFKETRISKKKRFGIYKFRTVKKEVLELLKNDKNQRSITEFTSYHDKSRYLTPVGAFLAQRYLDELPQLFNVIKGEMSLVGPRPHIPEHYENDLKAGMVVAKYIKAGVMGLVQASKGNLELRETFLRMDTGYAAKNKTITCVDDVYLERYLADSALEFLFYDIWIVFKCFLVVLKAQGI